MAKTNYSFEKRQRELEKKRKQEAKRLRKLDERAGIRPDQDSDSDPGEALETQGAQAERPDAPTS